MHVINTVAIVTKRVQCEYIIYNIIMHAHSRLELYRLCVQTAALVCDVWLHGSKEGPGSYNYYKVMSTFMSGKLNTPDNACLLYAFVQCCICSVKTLLVFFN